MGSEVPQAHLPCPPGALLGRQGREARAGGGTACEHPGGVGGPSGSRESWPWVWSRPPVPLPSGPQPGCSVSWRRPCWDENLGLFPFSLVCSWRSCLSFVEEADQG